MPIEKYMIVNATQLDADLASIANKIKAKLNETGEYKFPDDFLSAIDKMVYDANPNTENDLSVSGKTVTANPGYYPTAVSKSVDEGLVVVNDLEIISDPIITLSADGKSIVVNHSNSQAPTTSTTSGYVTSANVTVGTCSASGTKTETIVNLLGNKTSDNVVNNGNGTITIPAGYYAEDVTYTLPTTPAE